MQVKRTKTRKGLRKLREENIGPHQLSEEQVTWITCKETLDQQVGLSLSERRAQFLRLYPDKQVSVTTYRSIYRRHHIRKKKIRITKLNDASRETRIRRETRFMG